MKEIKKEAERLFELFYEVTPLDASVYDTQEEADSKIIKDRKLAKQCALICLDEIQKVVERQEDEHPNENFYYWYEVKQYIKDNY